MVQPHLGVLGGGSSLSARLRIGAGTDVDACRGRALRSDIRCLAAFSKSQGAGVLYSARDVIRRVESNTINWENEGVRKTLAQLRDLLNETAELPEAA